MFTETQNRIRIIMETIQERFPDALTSRTIPNRPFSIAIDGRCGSGKTTLAAELYSELERIYPHLSIELFHIDDFYPRPVQRTEERFKTPGGNVDHERFSEEVLENLATNQAFSYRPFDCASMELSEPVRISPSHIVLIEGSYSLHPELRAHYDLKIFLDIDPDEQKRRILNRNGEEKLRQFIERWIPLEELYFEGCCTRDAADIVL